jgi:hypothetical protein
MYEGDRDFNMTKLGELGGYASLFNYYDVDCGRYRVLSQFQMILMDSESYAYRYRHVWLSLEPFYTLLLPV